MVNDNAIHVYLYCDTAVYKLYRQDTWDTLFPHNNRQQKMHRSEKPIRHIPGQLSWDRVSRIAILASHDPERAPALAAHLAHILRERVGALEGGEVSAFVVLARIHELAEQVGPPTRRPRQAQEM